MNHTYSVKLESLAVGLRQAGLSESGTRINIHDDGVGFYAIPPNADSQTYDSWLVDDRNGKLVTKLAKEALLQLRPSMKSLSSASEVTKAVDEYVMKNGGKRAKPVRWNIKSYPD